MKEFVTILGRPIIVRSIENESGHHPEMVGYASVRGRVIGVRADLTDDDRHETILHEVVHFISDMMQLELDERTVSCLTTGLATAGCYPEVQTLEEEQ